MKCLPCSRLEFTSSSFLATRKRTQGDRSQVTQNISSRAWGRMQSPNASANALATTSFCFLLLQTHLLPSPHRLLHSTHTGSLATSQTLHIHSHLRAVALVLSVQKALPRDFMDWSFCQISAHLFSCQRCLP